MTTKTHVSLNTGAQMPIIGFGVFQIPAEDTEQAVIDALEVGYRHLDTAASYGNEESLGHAIAKSDVPRDDIFVTTKLWIQSADAQANTVKAFEASLKRLGLDYVDLYLIHQPLGDYYGEWRAMEGLHRDGRARAIGVSNFYPDRLSDLVEHNEITPAVNQIETHPFFQRATDHELLSKLGIQHESWGPLAEGKNDLFHHPVLGQIAEAHDRSIPQVVLRWLTQRDIVVIPKSVKRERMEQNLAVLDFEMTSDEIERITTLDEGESQFFDHRNPEMVDWLNGRRDR